MASLNSSKNLADELLAYAKTLPILDGLMGKGNDLVWEASLLLQIGASLAEAVNKFPALSGQQKSDLVCHTVLRLLDDGEKAEKERLAESTGTEITKVPWEELRSVVRAVLPQTLSLLVSAARGEFGLGKVVPVVSCCIGWFASATAKPKEEKQQPKGKEVKPPVSQDSQIFPNPLPLAVVPPAERAFLEVREPLPT